jgi:hypothetical protein
LYGLFIPAFGGILHLFEWMGRIRRMKADIPSPAQNYRMLPSLGFFALINLRGLMQGAFLSVFFAVRIRNLQPLAGLDDPFSVAVPPNRAFFAQPAPLLLSNEAHIIPPSGGRGLLTAGCPHRVAC